MTEAWLFAQFVGDVVTGVGLAVGVVGVARLLWRG